MKLLTQIGLGLAMAWLIPMGVKAEQLAKTGSVKCHLSERQENRDKTRTACVYKCPDGKKEREVIPKGASCPSYLDVAS